ncbi:MAG TPA: NAD(P)H-hydrate dehydratase [Candidatus Enterocloster faecavium]|uniref:Bifunctional NAD(P)H-hydrate repair enzyme n=1 Tax=Candidatus Enterocloster faecavium TaxID=2838560 RepID=A0A9D2L5S8_9FIRM|nr:NAD(P)H-hydrate dehydratase [Candidatus Enterocloster faecavium]
MRYLLTAKQAKMADAYSMEEMGIPSMVLMERAALAVAEAVQKEADREEPILAVCGVGNNGADGVAAARILYLRGYRAGALLVGNPEKGSRELKAQVEIARKLGMEIACCSGEQEIPEPEGMIIDAMFGVGLARAVEGVPGQWVERVNRLRESGKVRRVIAVDLPSGIDGDRGTVMGRAVKADLTVTFGWEKRGSVLYPGRAYSGTVITAEIGFPRKALEQLEEEPACTYGQEDLWRVPPRKAYSNKGTFGRILIVAGSENMCGAAYLSALAAYRAGAGLVKVLTVEENRPILQQLLPEAILASYTRMQLMEGREEFRQMIDAQCQWADVVILGPGLGNEEYVEYLVEDILTAACTPVVVDADGLNAIAAHPYLTSYFTENLVITPHLGEMARLTGQSVAEIQRDLVSCARNYALRYGLTCVLKDAATVVASRDGSVYLNTSGNSAMAKAGSGDVLTGVIGALLALGMEEKEAARLGVYLHGRAGDLAAGEEGCHGLLARELADHLREAMKQ